MAERNTHYADINGHYKAKSPMLPETLVDKKTDNVLAFLCQRLPIKASIVCGYVRHNITFRFRLHFLIIVLLNK